MPVTDHRNLHSVDRLNRLFEQPLEKSDLAAQETHVLQVLERSVAEKAAGV
jgi:hypothetical protein